MKVSRREIGILFPALAAAQSTAPGAAAPSMAFRFEDLPVKGSGTVSRQVLAGETHSKYYIDMHETELPAGQAPHAPHRHVHEELLMVREGQMEVTISGKTTQVGPGGGAYVASNELHGWRNVGTTTAHYFVIALGRETR